MTQEEQLKLVNRVFHLDPQTYLLGGLDANVNQAHKYVMSHWGFAGFDANNIHRMILDLVADGCFTPNPRYLEAFRSVFADGQFARKGGVGANESMILADLVKRDFEIFPCTAANVSQVVIDLWNQLADNSEYRDDKAARDTRDRQIDEMTGDGEHGFSVQRGPRKYAYEKDGRTHDPNKGMSQGFSQALKGAWSASAGKPFSAMTNDEVESLYNEWKATESFRNMDVKDLRKFVKSAGVTDLFGKTQHLPHEDVVALINPATGVEFKQRELIHYINLPEAQNPGGLNGRNLVNKDGRVRPGTPQHAARMERFSEIIKGLRG